MKLLRVIDETLPIVLKDDLDQHALDLKLEGWTVEDIFVPASEVKKPYLLHKTVISNKVWPELSNDDNTHVLLLGNVPQVSSGLDIGIDEISTDQGCLPTVVPWVTPGVAWTDTGDNTGGVGKARPAQRQNTPGDGWYDQETLIAAPPAAPTVARIRGCVGVVNFSKENPKVWRSTELTLPFRNSLYKNYFARIHAYRTGSLKINTPAAQFDYRSITIGPTDYFRQWAEATFGAKGYKFFNKLSTKESVIAAAPFLMSWDFKWLPTTPAAFDALGELLTVADFSFGSGQCAADSARLLNAKVRAALIVATHARNWDLEGLAKGLTFGQTWRNTVTASREVLFIVLYGDPTLKLMTVQL